MSKTLRTALLNSDERRQRLIVHITDIVLAEAQLGRGLSGFAVKAALKMVQGIHKEAVPLAVDFLLEDFVDALEELYQDFRTQKKLKNLQTYFHKHEERFSQSLLAVTDRHAQQLNHLLVQTTYWKLRPYAFTYVGNAAPKVGAMLDMELLQKQ